MDIIFYLILFKFIEPFIVFPFSISKSKNHLSINEKYDITDFFLDNIELDFYTTIDIGTPPQKLLSIISSHSHIFSLSSEDYISKYYETNIDLKSISKNGYNPYYSSSYKKINDIILFSKIPKNKSIISESIYLYNTTNEKIEKNSKIKIDNINIILEEDKNEQKHIIIGLNYETSKEVPYIVKELKRLNIIKNYNWSFKFLTKTEGQFIIGVLPHNYENNKFYNKNSYTKILTSSTGDYSYPWSIHFNEIYFKNNNKKFTISHITKCTLVPNLGFILGNSQYKKLLLENYFNDLIDNNICHLEKTEVTKYNKTKIFYGTTGVYEFFTCDKNKFTNIYKSKFMPLLFELNKYNYTFNLNDEDLFFEIHDKYYFLVAFPENVNESFYIYCFLGLPFYQKYRLVFNFDSKTIGFYNPNIKNDIEDEENNINSENMKNKNNNLRTNDNKKIIFEIFFCIFLFFVAYYIGKKINEQRKKRANELNDDNYEYILENNKLNNKDVNNRLIYYNNYKMENKDKIMEMSSNIKNSK